jgi:hypothetical protein
MKRFHLLLQRKNIKTVMFSNESFSPFFFVSAIKTLSHVPFTQHPDEGKLYY